MIIMSKVASQRAILCLLQHAKIVPWPGINFTSARDELWACESLGRVIYERMHVCASSSLMKSALVSTLSKRGSSHPFLTHMK